jgi:hypothetical protein
VTPKTVSMRATPPGSWRSTRFLRLSIAAVLALALSFALVSAPSFAAFDRTAAVEEEFEATNCGAILDIAVDEANEYVYVSCNGGGFGNRTIRRFDFDGDPANFSASVPYIEGNAITESPSNPSGSLGAPRIAIDNSSANPGHLYMVPGQTTAGGSEFIDVFSPTGEAVIAIPPVGAFPGTKSDVDVGPDGHAYTVETDFSFHPVIAKFDPSFKEVARVYSLLGGESVAVDSTGATWQIIEIFGGGSPTRVSKWEADQFSSDLSVNWGASEAEFNRLKASTSPFFPDPLTTGGDLQNLDVDLNRNDLYVNRGNRIEVYSQGSAEEPAFKNAPDFGSPVLSGSNAVVVTEDNRVFASTGGTKVVRFGPGKTLPDVKTKPALPDDLGHTEATVSGEVKLAGGADITECMLEYGLTISYGSVAPCSPDPSVTNFTTDTPVSAVMSSLTTGKTYHYRFKAASSEGSNVGVDRIVRPAFVLKVQTLPVTAVTDSGATLRGSFDPDGISTTDHFEYGVDTSYGLKTAESSSVSAPGETQVEVPVSGLTSGKTWHYRIVATNANGTTIGPDRTFRTASPPELQGVRATEVKATSAWLRARINPSGYATDYRFEYGPTAAYGKSVPIPDGSAGAGSGPVDVAHQVEGLQPGVTYHFRLVATNQWGTSESADTTFDFSPPTCPNDHVRQQALSSYLPDCRAYELVSPASTGAVLLQPGAQIWEQTASQNPNGYEAVWSQNSGLATSPSRFTYWAALGTISGLNGKITTGLEMFAATRTNTGWVTTLPSYKGNEILQGGRHQCSDSISLCLEHDEGFFGVQPQKQSVGVFTVEGELIDEWPTNVNAIPNGDYFNGSMRASGDFSHFVFASSDVVFAPGGRSGGLGSAYDNDIEARTVSVISKNSNGTDIEQDGEPSAYQRFEFPGVSPDGSHVLMRTPSSEGHYRLHMRVDDTFTYDVSRGAGVRLVDMTRDGSTVYFVASQRLTADDTDEGDDLYMWSEVGDVLTRISKGNGNGNSDTCISSVNAKCGVLALDTERDHPFELPSLDGIDDLIAEENGDVYFYSPELLDPTQAGIKDQKNLYVYRNGDVRLVATLDKGTSIDRMQISPDGLHAGMVTASQLTAFDNAGFKQMYTYDAATREIFCASCNPSGLPPESDVEASQNGLFMANDGRAFFATHDSLVPRDSNGKIIDVYEYVGGRPQLITSGVGSRDFTGGSKAIGLFLAGVNTGLEGVSRDGTDVYFSTYDTLVTEDQNGEFVKFYNARTNGGFAPAPELGPCAAADECHGPDSSPPAPPVVSTGVPLGQSGNAGSERRPRQRDRRKKAQRRRAQKRKSKSRQARKGARRSHG